MLTINISNLNISEVNVSNIHFVNPISNIDTKLCPKCNNIKNVKDFSINQYCCKICLIKFGKNALQKYIYKIIDSNYQKHVLFVNE